MCKIILTVVFVIFCQHLSAQGYPANFNLINDPGFEAKYYPSSRDTDLNNSCWVKAGINYLTDQFYPSVKIFPHSGKRFLSVVQTSKLTKATKPTTIPDTSKDDGRRYLESRLITPLVAGETYYFSAWIGTIKDKSNSYLSSPAVIFSNLGVTFTTTQIKDYSSTFVIPSSPIVDLSNWTIAVDNDFTYTKVSASFVATGGEQYITIGNFDYFNQFKVIFSKENDFFTSPSVIIIDDVSLTKDTTQTLISIDGFNLGRDTILCSNDTLTIGGASYYSSYRWNTGDTSRLLKIYKPGKYWCRAIFGCNQITDTIDIIAPSSPVSFDVKDIFVCPKDLPLNLSAPVIADYYDWSNGEKTKTTILKDEGTFWLRTLNSCRDNEFIDTFSLKFSGLPISQINLGEDFLNCRDNYDKDTFSLKVNAGINNVLWSTGETVPKIETNIPSVYWVKVSNKCYAQYDTIEVKGCENTGVEKLKIPNAFSPNGDGLNDVFRINYLPQNILSLNLKIYNRFGQMVYEFSSPSDYWNGGDYGLGIYYFYVSYKDLSGRNYLQKGDVTLIR